MSTEREHPIQNKALTDWWKSWYSNERRGIVSKFTNVLGHNYSTDFLFKAPILEILASRASARNVLTMLLAYSYSIHVL